MAGTFNFTLEMSDVMQVLDALSNRAEAWEKTEAALNGDFESEDDFKSEDFFVPEECNDPSEAAEIAQHFRDIIATIEAQLNQANL